MNKKFIASCVMIYLLVLSPLMLSAKKSKIALGNDKEVKHKIELLDLDQKVVITPVVRRKINNYILWSRKNTENILGRLSTYKPMIDQIIEEKNLPKELAYLPIIESAVDPHAKSYQGALGLWQFMKSTAKAKGLKVNGKVDERKDPYKSTVKALDYLNELYKMYGDWGLALAAYNCGPGTLNKAIRVSGRRVKTFWDVQQFLPIETQSYVPGFIAASYVANYYQQHKLEPTGQSIDELFTAVVQVTDKINLDELSAELDVPKPLLVKLNPSYHSSIISGSSQGNYIVIPHSKLHDFDSLFCDTKIVYAPDEIIMAEPATDAYALMTTETERETDINSSLIEKHESNQIPVPSSNNDPDQILQKAHIINDRVYRYLKMSKGSDTKDGYAGIPSGSDEVVSMIIEHQFILHILPVYREASA
jgi:hypothetical protein